jgi:hypothetical protein
MSGVASLIGDNVLNKAGEKVNVGEHCAGKVVGLYFSVSIYFIYFLNKWN